MSKLARLERHPETVAEVRQELEASRRRLTASADSLRDDLRESYEEIKQGAQELRARLSWRTQVARHPWGFVVGAVAIGIYLGRRRRS